MARPSIPEERYEQAITQMLADGVQLDQITATKLQANVGGRYSRAAELLKAFQEAHSKTQQAEQPDKPEWFDEFQHALLSQTDRLWSDIVNPEIQRRYAQAAKETEQVRHESRAFRKDDLQHITTLEDNNEQQSEEIAALTHRLASEQAKREQAEEQHYLKDEAKQATSNDKNFREFMAQQRPKLEQTIDRLMAEKAGQNGSSTD